LFNLLFYKRDCVGGTAPHNPAITPALVKSKTAGRDAPAVELQKALTAMQNKHSQEARKKLVWWISRLTSFFRASFS
jgi:hypothetical protein